MKPQTLGTLTGVVFLLLSILPGCKKPKQVILTKEQQLEISDSVVQTAPKPTLELNVKFGESIRLLGMDAPSGSIGPGQEIELVYYWHVLQPPGEGWKIFGHLEGGGHRQILDHHPVRNLYPTRQWKAGEYVIDRQKVTVDKKFSGQKLTLWTGLFDEIAWSSRKENKRLPIVEAGSATVGKGDRAKVLTLSFKGKKGQAGTQAGPGMKPQRYGVQPADSPIVIDGKLDDVAWLRAQPTGNFVKANGSRGTGSLATVGKWTYDSEALYLGVTVKDPDIQSPFTERDSTLWKADVVEFFLRPGNDEGEYVEIQVNPANVLFDARFTSHRKPEWKQAAAEFNAQIESAVSLQGTLNDASDKDESWTVEMRIPFKDLPGVTESPRPGDRWRANLYRIDHAGPRNPQFQRTWSPVGNDFHQLKGAGELVFAPGKKRATPSAPGNPTE